VLPKRASGYVLEPNGYVNAPYLDMTIPYAAGSLYSTVEDLYLWDRALYLDKLLPAPLKQQMFTPGLGQYANGWFVNPIKLNDGVTEVATISHGGGINGFVSVLIRVPARKELVILLDNTSRGDRLQDLAAGVLSILHGISPRQPRTSIGEVVLATITKSSVAEGIAQYKALKSTKADDYDFSEKELARVGYRLLDAGRAADAVEILKLSVELFPSDGRAYGLLGEAYMAVGNKEQAIASYRRALELNPDNTNAVKMLKKLEEHGPN
jgi:tetratricopeptide (TPR) repeat protein